MNMLPRTDAMLVLRTDFSDQSAWDAVRAAIGEPGEDGFLEDYASGVEFLDDAAYRDLPPERILPLIPEEYDHPILVVVDKTTIASSEMPLLIIDLSEEYGRTVRVVPAQLPSIEVNLSLANMDFFEFADSADDDGVFRGFSG